MRAFARTIVLSAGIWSLGAMARPSLPCAQPAGSSPEAAMEGIDGQRDLTPEAVPLDEAKAQMVGPACSQAVRLRHEQLGILSAQASGLELMGCVDAVERMLGWDQEAFAACEDAGIMSDRVSACSATILTFLLHDPAQSDAESQATATFALMKDLCAPTSLCGTGPNF